MADLGYLFSSAPRSVQSTLVTTKPAAKYRDVPVNIMFDKRVIRGPTVQPKPTTLSLQPTASAAILKSKQTKQTTQTRANNQSAQSYQSTRQLETSQSYNANQTLQFSYQTSACVQTDDYLEELGADVAECDNYAQTEDLHTDLDVDRVLALFAPAVRGVDAWTCIEGQELFDFDLEVESILAVLVGKALDQAEIEVNEEQELAALTAQRAAFAAERARVIAEKLRLEAENTRRAEEKARRVEQERERVTEEHRIALQREAAQAAQQAMLELERRTQAEIKAQWKDPVKQQVESSFMPWLTQSVEMQLTTRQQYSEQVDALMREAIDVMDQRIAEHTRMVQERKAAEALQAELALQAAAEEAERRRIEQEQVLADAAAALLAANSAEQPVENESDVEE